jgi:hypothetical protein
MLRGKIKVTTTSMHYQYKKCYVPLHDVQVNASPIFLGYVSSTICKAIIKDSSPKKYYQSFTNKLNKAESSLII